MPRRFIVTGFAIAALLAVVSVGLAVAALSGQESSETETRTGVIEVALTLEADPPVAARTWAFEVVNADDEAIDRLVLTTADAQLTVSGRSSTLPHGAYSVRQVLTDDDRTECGPGALYAVVTPPGGSLSLRLEGPVALAEFVVTICE